MPGGAVTSRGRGARRRSPPGRGRCRGRALWRRREGGRRGGREGGGGGGRAQGAAAAWLAGVALGSAPAGALARSGTIGLNLNRVKLHKGAKRSRRRPRNYPRPALTLPLPPLPSTPPSPARPGQGSPSSPLSPAPVRASNSVRVCCVRVCCVRDPHPASPPPGRRHQLRSVSPPPPRPFGGGQRGSERGTPVPDGHAPAR